MAKGKGHRQVPRTPDPTRVEGVEPAGLDDEAASADAGPALRPIPVPDRRAAPPGPGAEPYLISGTNCLAGHERGAELEAGPIGPVPTRRKAWIGFGLLLWCGIGLALILDPRWISVGIVVVIAWLLFSALVQRRLGHRGMCWRTRSWRHAWGGLVPGWDSSADDPARD